VETDEDRGRDEQLRSAPHGDLFIVPDSEQRGLIGALPAAPRPYASLIRLDRPIGAWLLFWPCAWSVALAGAGRGLWVLVLWLALGAWAMRSAGCVYNDIIDRDLDARVERTRLRPLASGRVSLKGAWALLAAMSLIGLVVLLQLDRTAQIVALASLAPVAAYPFMKRITWWPQAWLGLVFSWGALVGWPAVKGHLGAPACWLWAGSIFWVIGYDTIYALQDREDDALVGVRSSARALGRHARLGVAICYLIAVGLWAVSLHQVRREWFALLGLLPIALHLFWQAATVRPDDGDDALAKFRSNRMAGFLMFLACLVVGNA
jgi:4-hydroxybenzoate polyprenyltransferase